MLPFFALTAILMRMTAPAAAPVAMPAALSADLDGDGQPESISLFPRGRKLRLEIRSAAGGKVLAEATPPQPASGATEFSLAAGVLGSSGALLEAISGAASDECRSVWRFREGKLSRVPVLSGSGVIPDCGRRGEWTYSWERAKEDAPAVYQRQRTRETAAGPHHQVEAFRYAGFRLEADPAHSYAEIGGVRIPEWYPARLYRRTALDGLYARYDLTGLKRGTRLLLVTDPAAGQFAVRIDTPPESRTFPVTLCEAGQEKNELVLTLGSHTPPMRLRVTLAGGSRSPGEAILSGHSKELDGLYSPAMRLTDRGVHIFARAEDELAVNGLVGTWVGSKGDAMPVTLASAEPVLLGVGKARYRVEVDGAPDGIDALLVPNDGGPPVTGVSLRGPNALARIPVRCADSSAASAGCRESGPGELLHRVGARLNAR